MKEIIVIGNSVGALIDGAKDLTDALAVAQTQADYLGQPVNIAVILETVYPTAKQAKPKSFGRKKIQIS